MAEDATKWNKILHANSNDRWFNGPPFLFTNEGVWPIDITVGCEAKEEMRIEKVNVMFHKTNQFNLKGFQVGKEWFDVKPIFITILRC